MQWTEQAIKATLDGTFTHVSMSGVMFRKEVPLDYLPSHRPMISGSRKGVKRQSYRRFTAEEDAAIIAGVAAGQSHAAIGRLIDRNDSTISKRIQLLRWKAGKAVLA